MTTLVHRRRRTGSTLAVAGGVLGMIAGVAQSTVGSSIPAWTGAKASPGALGLLTVALSALATASAVTLRRPQIRAGGLLAAVAGVAVPALVCFTTVGRLWLIPGPLLLIGAALSVENGKEVIATARQEWLRILLAALGATELLMAAGAAPVPMTIGIVGGTALVGAASLATRARLVAAGLVVVGTVPFAAVAWAAIIPVLVLVLAAGLAVPVVRASPAAREHARTR
ncbi:MAG TPA: hypothetical protein VEK80_00440 [Kribbellaceae bacterium]|nr:hypothetical protein [Kribbellaceae bacterium]